jgi:hypothetical protein
MMAPSERLLLFVRLEFALRAKTWLSGGIIGEWEECDWRRVNSAIMIREDTLYMVLPNGLGLFEKKAASAGNDSATSPGCRRERSLALAGSILEKKSRL